LPVVCILRSAPAFPCADNGLFQQKMMVTKAVTDNFSPQRRKVAVYRMVFTACLCLLFFCHASAQTFVDQLRKSNKGEGTVIIVQDELITKLVNGKSHQFVREEPKLIPEKEHTPSKTATATSKFNDAAEISLGDTRTAPVATQKTYRRSYSVQGYRIQIYSGDDSRKARQKANQMGNQLKALFPELPVYTHFYSPHWTCRVGDFRSYQEANSVLHQIKATGSFKAASIIKSRIQVRL
jgi:hypothetical protein